MNAVKVIRHVQLQLSWYRAELERAKVAITKLGGNTHAKELTQRADLLLSQLHELTAYLTDQREELDSAHDQEAESGVVQEGGRPEAARADEGGKEAGVAELPTELPVRVRPEPGAGKHPPQDEGGTSRRKKEGK